MSDLKRQLRDAWALAAPTEHAARRVRERLGASPACSSALGRDGGRLARALAVLAVTGWACALLAWRPRGAEPASLSVRDVRSVAIDGRAGTFLTLEDDAGRRYHLVQADLQDEVAAGGVEVHLDFATLRVTSRDGVVVGLAVPRDASRSPAVHRARTLVSASDGSRPSDEEDPMTDRTTTDATSRLTRAALLALASYSIAAPIPAAERATPVAAPGAAPAAPGATTVARSAAVRPRLVAIKVHADWCVTCRKVGRVFDDLARRLEDQPVMFVEMDITSEATIRQSHYLAAALGLQGAWDERQGAGYILLVDAATRSVVGRMGVDLAVDELERRTRDAL